MNSPLSSGGVLDLVVALLQLAGAVLFFASAVGVWRLPTFAARVHSPTKAASLGIALFAGALALHHVDPRWWIEIGLLVLFVFITVPLSTQVLLRSAEARRESVAEPAAAESPGNRIMEG